MILRFFSVILTGIEMFIRMIVNEAEWTSNFQVVTSKEKFIAAGSIPELAMRCMTS